MTNEKLIEILEERFQANMHLHENIKWEDVVVRLNDQVLESLMLMELSMGEPDVVKYDEVNDKYVFFDTVKESPDERGSITYDQEAENIRLKKNMPTKGNAVTLAKVSNTNLLDEDDYFFLQSLADFDLKRSVWLKTPDSVREKGGALFGDKRYGRVFIYHNGADSFYKSRGFRSKLEV